jgi:hypothetical protein
MPVRVRYTKAPGISLPNIVVFHVQLVLTFAWDIPHALIKMDTTTHRQIQACTGGARVPVVSHIFRLKFLLQLARLDHMSRPPPAMSPVW